MGHWLRRTKGSSPSLKIYHVITILYVNKKAKKAALVCLLLDLSCFILYQLYKRTPSEVDLTYYIHTLNFHIVQPVKMKSPRQVLDTSQVQQEDSSDNTATATGRADADGPKSTAIPDV